MKKLITIFAIILGGIGTLHAADITVTGTVLDDTGKPMIGASILSLQNTKKGTSTDLDGKFTISVPQDSQLKISYIGYKTEEVPVNQNMNIILREEPLTIEEAVVTAQMRKAGDSCDIEGRPNMENVKSAVLKKINEKLQCVPTECISKQYYIKDNKCENIDGTPCIGNQLKNGITAGTRKFEGGQVICIPTACETPKYELKDDGACLRVDGLDCTPKQLDAIPNATAGERKVSGGKEICVPTSCKPGYEPSGEQCIAIGGDCAKRDLPENATNGTRSFADGAEICIATKCKEGYKVTDGKCVFGLTEEQSAAKVEELKKNAADLRAKETSMENKIIGTAAIGATGIGLMNAMSANAEQKADETAEADMSAYLATMRCSTGSGPQYKYGPDEITLPGANVLGPNYTEYKNLATALKSAKEQLGMSPGIESETLLDKADGGLYDNAALGKTGGAYTSLARALSDPSGADAEKWNAQKSETASNLKSGMTTAAVGIGVGVVGNLLVNSTGDTGKNIFGKTVATDKTDEINEKYKKIIADAMRETQKKVDSIPTPPTECRDGAKPDDNGSCICPDPKNQQYNTEEQKCIPIDKTLDCGQGVADANNTCFCENGYEFIKSDKTCKCDPSKIEEGGKCKDKTLSNAQKVDTPSITFPGTMFKLGESKVADSYKDEITKFVGENIPKGFDECLYVTGNTDKTGEDTLNKRLSRDRAIAVVEILTQNGVNSANVVAIGAGSENCKTVCSCPPSNPDCKAKRCDADKKCRNVKIELKPAAECLG